MRVTRSVFDGEACIIIDGAILTESQATTLRVAITRWLSDTDGLDALGPIGGFYRQRLEEIEDMLTRLRP